MALPVAAQRDTNSNGFVEALVPIVVAQRSTPGAYGSLWASELWIHNSGTTAVNSIQLGEGFAPCPPNETCGPTAPAGQTKQAFPHAFSTADRGALLMIPADRIDDLTLSSRVLELSRRAQPNGIDVPVVWEDEYLTGTTMLLAVPQNADSRIALRVFDPRRIQGSALNIEFLRPDGTVVASTTLRPGDNTELRIPVPSYATINDLATSIPALLAEDRIDIRITPLTPNLEYWVYAAITDRDTQHVLLVTPDN
jgi:hypothetical protein